MANDYGASLARHIGMLRKQAGYTQEQLAVKLGVTYQAVSKWENGGSCPDVMLLPVLADVFGVTLDELFGKTRSKIDLREGLLAEYRFDGHALDSSGNGFDGTVHGAVPCPDRFGRMNSAYLFDGVDDYVVIDPAPRLGADAFSLSVWCCYADTMWQDGWSHAIVSQDGHHGRRVFQLSTYDSTITFHRFLSEPDLQAESPIRPGYWYHIAVTYEARRFRFYKNGELVCEREGSFAIADDEPLYIGRKSTDEPYFYFRGMIDDVRLYNRELHEDEVKALFLENGWRPIPEPLLPEAREQRVLECVEDVQMKVAAHHIDAAADWYKSHLGFKPLIEHERAFYLLTLRTGPSLLLHAEDVAPNEELEDRARWTPFVFKTKMSLEQLEVRLNEAGARDFEIRDEGFATFMSCRDPFGQAWTLMKENR